MLSEGILWVLLAWCSGVLCALAVNQGGGGRNWRWREAILTTTTTEEEEGEKKTDGDFRVIWLWSESFFWGDSDREER